MRSLVLCLTLFCLLSCGSEEKLNPITIDDLIGKWELRDPYNFTFAGTTYLIEETYVLKDDLTFEYTSTTPLLYGTMGAYSYFEDTQVLKFELEPSVTEIQGVELNQENQKFDWGIISLEDNTLSVEIFFDAQPEGSFSTLNKVYVRK